MSVWNRVRDRIFQHVSTLQYHVIGHGKHNTLLEAEDDRGGKNRESIYSTGSKTPHSDLVLHREELLRTPWTLPGQQGSTEYFELVCRHHKLIWIGATTSKDIWAWVR